MLRNLSLRYKLIVPILAIEILTFSILAWNTELFIHRGMSEGVSIGAQTAADLLADLYADSIANGSTEVIEGYVQEITEEQGLHYIAIEDASGRFLAYSTGEHLEADSGLFSHIFENSDEVFEVSAVITGDGLTHGTVRVGFSPNKSFDLVSTGRRRALLIVSAALILSVLVIWIMIRAITGPLVRVSGMTQRIAAGDLDQRIDVRSTDEVGRLAGSFNRMAGRLQNSYENLEKIESTKMASLGELAACIANEVRNPLAGISSCSQVLQRRFAGNHETEELLGMIASDVRRLEEVVRSFIDFARLSKPELRNTRIVDVVEQAIALIEVQAKSQKIEVQRDFRDRELSLLIDERQIRQALLNVFINALQSMPDGGRLGVSIQSGSDSVLIKITDTGEGVTPEQVAYVFDPFYTTKHQGTGLGLPIAQIIVEDHGGRSVVESSKGKGTTVTIELPFDGMQKRIDTLMRMSV
jgi:signal transduction histidine kinase